VQASPIGNDDFDFGTRLFSDIVIDAAFPYVSANLNLSANGDIAARYLETVGVNGLEDAATLARQIVSSAVVNSGGDLIGLAPSSSLASGRAATSCAISSPRIS
jgi:hypothetical protein